MVKTFRFFILVLLLAAQNGFAQSSWTLGKCIDYALENSLSIQQAEISEEYTEIAAKTALHQRIPSLSANSSLSYSLGRSIDPTSNDFISASFLSNGVSLSSGIVLFNGLRITNSIKKSRFDKKAAREDTRQWRRDIAMNVATAYLAILFASENLENANRQYQSTLKQLEKITKLINAGARPIADRYDLDAQAALDEQNIISQENSLSKAYLDLKNLIRYNENQDFRIAVPDIEGLELHDPMQLKLEELYFSSLQHQPSIAAGDMRLKSAEFEKKMAKAAYYPTLAIGGSLTTNYSNKAREVVDYSSVIFDQTVYINNVATTIGFPSEIPNFKNVGYGKQIIDNVGYGAGLQLSIPIYSNMQSKAQLDRAKLNIRSVEIANEQERQRLKSNIQLALSNAQSAKKQLLASRKSMESLQIAFENATKKYEIGLIGSYEFLNIKDKFENSKTSMLIARYDFIFSVKVLDFYVGLPLNF